ncbi:MAG: hypothetical protein ACLUI3_06835 [Christensenellales bacterium]
MRTFHDGQRNARRPRRPAPYTRTHDVAADELPGEAALRRIIDTCRSNGIEPVLMALPAPVSEEEQMEMNRAQLLADELGVPFLNLFDERPRASISRRTAMIISAT